MDADLDQLLTTVFVTADDLGPESTKRAARRVTDAEVVSLCVARAIMAIPSDRRFLAVAAKRLAHRFPDLPQQPGYFKPRRRAGSSSLTGAINDAADYGYCANRSRFLWGMRCTPCSRPTSPRSLTATR
jgi:hypothetical protein